MHGRAIAVAFAISVGAHAADRMSHSVVGWSADGRYFAFERSVALDGSGYPMCEVLVVDTDAGELSAGPFKSVLEDDRISPEHACVAARDQAQQALESRRIDPAFSGKRLRLAPSSGAPDGDRGMRSARMSFREGGRSCTLRLAQTPRPSPAPELPFYAWQLGLSCGGEEQILPLHGMREGTAGRLRHRHRRGALPPGTDRRLPRALHPRFRGDGRDADRHRVASAFRPIPRRRAPAPTRLTPPFAVLVQSWPGGAPAKAASPSRRGSGRDRHGHIVPQARRGRGGGVPPEEGGAAPGDRAERPRRQSLQRRGSLALGPGRPPDRRQARAGDQAGERLGRSPRS